MYEDKSSARTRALKLSGAVGATSSAYLEHAIEMLSKRNPSETERQGDLMPAMMKVLCEQDMASRARSALSKKELGITWMTASSQETADLVKMTTTF